MAASSDILQEILNLKKNKHSCKTASSKLDAFTSALLKIAEEMEKEEEEEEENEEMEKEEEKNEEKNEENTTESKDKKVVEDIVEAALAELNKEAKSKNRGVNVNNINYDKLAAAMLKKLAVNGTGVYGLDKDMTADPKADPGIAAQLAEALTNIRTTKETTEDEDLGVAGPVDSMKNQAPQPFGGGEGGLIPSDEKGISAKDIKEAVAKMSKKDALMYHKLAMIGFEVAADVLSDEILEKHAQQLLIEEANRMKVAEAYNYLLNKALLDYGGYSY